MGIGLYIHAAIRLTSMNPLFIHHIYRDCPSCVPRGGQNVHIAANISLLNYYSWSYLYIKLENKLVNRKVASTIGFVVSYRPTVGPHCYYTSSHVSTFGYFISWWVSWKSSMHKNAVQTICIAPADPGGQSGLSMGLAPPAVKDFYRASAYCCWRAILI